MSITAIAGSNSQIWAQYRQVQGRFKQLGQDLKAGDLTKAQSDFVTLSQSAASQLGSKSSVSQALNAMGQALQSGNLTAAQQAFSSLTQVGPCAVPHSSHVPPMNGALSQAFSQLGKDLQSASLSAAQQAFAAIQKLWQQMSGTTLTPGASSESAASTTSVSV
jgi:hypothetical protein